MAEHFNRFKLGRSLDKVFSYGCDLLFSEVALSVCQQEGIDLRFNCLDTTINSKQLEMLIQLAYTEESDNPFGSEALIKEAFLTSS